MAITFRDALKIARKQYPHRINHYEEYEKYYVFDTTDCFEHVGGEYSPIVIRKSDAMALAYAPIFFNMNAEAEDVGEVISEGKL